MKFYPYSRLKSENLKPLLFATRLLAGGSYLSFLITFFLIIAIPFLGSEAITQDIGGGMTMSFRTPDDSGAAIIGSIFSLVNAVFLLVLSGLCGAVVSFEYKYTKPSNLTEN
ncbi:hypothetical protein L9G15_19715 [Shewanella sp. A3A]|nr:hypothetical protein [Shewanella ferrihydritica]